MVGHAGPAARRLFGLTAVPAGGDPSASRGVQVMRAIGELAKRVLLGACKSSYPGRPRQSGGQQYYESKGGSHHQRTEGHIGDAQKRAGR